MVFVVFSQSRTQEPTGARTEAVLLMDSQEFLLAGSFLALHFALSSRALRRKICLSSLNSVARSLGSAQELLES